VKFEIMKALLSVLHLMCFSIWGWATIAKVHYS